VAVAVAGSGPGSRAPELSVDPEEAARAKTELQGW
jgi:hypothetical protein